MEVLAAIPFALKTFRWRRRAFLLISIPPNFKALKIQYGNKQKVLRIYSGKLKKKKRVGKNISVVVALLGRELCLMFVMYNRFPPSKNSIYTLNPS